MPVSLPGIDIISFTQDEVFKTPIEESQIRIKVKSTSRLNWNGRVADKYELFLALEYEKGKEEFLKFSFFFSGIILYVEVTTLKFSDF
jgi:hypothetical protein